MQSDFTRIALSRLRVLFLLAAMLIATGGAALSAAPDRGIFVSNAGSDRNDGTSPASAFRTITAALNRARPGDTIQIQAGTYHEQVVTVRGGAPGAEIVLRSFGGIARIDGSTLKWSSGRNQNQALVELRHPFVRLSGLAIVNSKNTGILLNADDLTVEDCFVSDTRLHGISTETSRQLRSSFGRGQMIRRILIRGNTLERVALAGRSQGISLIADGFTIADNTVRDSPKEGIDVWLGSRRGSVEGNTVHGNAAVGIYVDGAAYVSITRNVVFANRAGIGISSEDTRYNTHDIWVFNNIVRDNRGDGIFLWDDQLHPGYRGSQDVLIAHNTLVRNRTSLRFSGSGNSGWAINNLGQSGEADIVIDFRHSNGLKFGGNVWLKGAEGFASPATPENLHLSASSPALGKAIAVPGVTADATINIRILKDFDGQPRLANGGADAGALEYQRSSGARP